MPSATLEEPSGDRGHVATPRRTRAERGSLAAAVLYALTTGLFALTMLDRIGQHTAYNHFALLAEAWLHGRLDLGGSPPSYTGMNDFAVHDGKYFVSFPPFPAVLLLPVVALAGGAAAVRDGAFFLGLAGVGPAVLLLALERLSSAGRSARSLRENTALAALFAVGTVYWSTAVQGTVWFAAHVVAVPLAALYLWASVDAAHPALAGLALGLGFATRTPLAFAFPFFVAEAIGAARREEPAPGARFAPRIAGVPLVPLASRLALFGLPAALVLAALLLHNRARFGDPFEFGHRMLAIAWKPRIDRWGLFSYHYLARNLSVVLAGLPFTQVEGAPFEINVHGLALWLTTPIYAFALWPRRTGATFWALAMTAAAVALPSLLYQNTGWIQFGYRFSNDFAPFLFAMIAVGGRRFGGPFVAAAAFGIAVNAFGAVTFQRPRFDRFYFVDRTQKILVQPD
jgi:hypothetical protein